MKTFALASTLILTSWPSMASACVSPTPNMMAWAKCGVSKLPSKARSDLNNWLNGPPRPENSQAWKALQQKSQKWIPDLNRACGAYSLLRKKEENRLRRAGEHVHQEYFGANELDLLLNYLWWRKETGEDDVKGCGG